MIPCRFYFDFISPYAYLAWTQIHGLGVAVEPQPVVFAALLNAHGTRGPAEVPARRRYLIRDVVRIAHRFGVPIAPPPAHPFNPILALRVASIAELAVAERRAVIDGLYRAVWVDGRGVEDPAVVAAIAREAGVADAIARANADATKARLRAQTDDAIARGLFGVPSMVVDDQVFWGCDALPHLQEYLVRGDVVDAALAARWEALPASATRKQ